MITTHKRLALSVVAASAAVLFASTAFAANAQDAVDPSAETVCPNKKTTCINFAGAKWLYEPFEGLVSAEQFNDPIKANRPNKVAKFVKGPTGAPWAGATIYTNAADKSVAPLGLNVSLLVKVRVFSAAAGQNIRLKVEQASNPAVSVETDQVTTVAGAWETLTFDLGNPAPGTPAYNSSKVYNKLSLFPQFSVTAPPATDTTTYFDDVQYAKYKAPTGGPLVFASNYSDVGGISWVSAEGGAAGNYIDDTVPSQLWWRGNAPGDSTPSFYFGYGINVNQKPWGFGAYVNAPGNGTAQVKTYTNMKIAVWGNDELMNHHPNLTMVLVGPVISGCAAELVGSVAVSAPGVQNYSVPLAGLTLQKPCAFANAAAALAGGVAAVNVQVLGSNMQFTSATDGLGNYANGLNIGPISFE